MADILQKEIYLANLEPVIGNEQGGKRPVLVISGNTMNSYYMVVLVCPLTKVIKNLANCPLIKKNRDNKLSTDSQVLTFHMRAISKQRLIKKIGEITGEELTLIHAEINSVLEC